MGMIPLTNHDSRVRENSEVVIIYPAISNYGRIIPVFAGADPFRLPRVASKIAIPNSYGLSQYSPLNWMSIG